MIDQTIHGVHAAPAAPGLRGWRLRLAWAGWTAIVGLTAWLFVGSVPINYALRSTPCSGAGCAAVQLSTADAAALEAVGLSPRAYAASSVAVDVLVAAAYGLSAVLIAARKPADRLALLVSLALVTFGAVTLTGAASGLALVQPVWRGPARLIGLLGDVGLLAVFFIFPSGRWVPRWGWAAVGLWGLLQAPRYFLPGTAFDLSRAAPALYAVLFLLGLAAGLAAQVYRYRRVAGPTERQQAKWAVFGLVTALSGFPLAGLGLQAAAAGQSLRAVLAISLAQRLVMLLIPASLVMAVLRYRLWDIDPLISRTAVYALLTAAVAAVYVLIVGGLGALFQARGSLVLAVAATAAAAVLFEPLRARLQRGLNVLVYGERDDPAAALARLGRQLQAAAPPEAVLPAVVQTVAQALKLPYVAIRLRQAGAEQVVAEWGQPQPLGLELPLTYQGETIGHLGVAPRAPGEALAPGDRRTLALLAQQAGVAAQAVRLANELRQVNADLQRSREHLVAAREEERRRLRRDLHDGLGPTLASLAQRLDHARLLAGRDPEAAGALLADLKGQVRATLADIRRLVYALRPPVLDELGLLSALREHTAQASSGTGLRVSVEAPERLPPLPAAVEVAAYRIVLEAFTNVLRHAEAAHCRITLWIEGDPPAALAAVVSDDGRGLPQAAGSAGVGLSSMRERAAELGGEWAVEAEPGGGTRVWARLPIPQE